MRKKRGTIKIELAMLRKPQYKGRINKGDRQMTRTIVNQPLRMMVCQQVLEAAKDAGDHGVIAACRALIAANRIGRDRGMAEWKIVYAFAA